MQRIVIVGMGRSGTTFITEFLGKCGVFLDDVNWAYEHEFARLINDSILAQEFGAKPGKPYGRLPSQEIKLSDRWHRLSQFYLKYMESQAIYGHYHSWAFKDPRTTILHNIWLGHFDIVVGIFRSPQEVVASYIGQGWIKGFWKERCALYYWKRFNQSLLNIYQMYVNKKPIYILDYNKDMIGQLMMLCNKLGIELSEQAKSLFNPSLNHYAIKTFPKDDEVMDIYRNLQVMSMVGS
jgi:hypothetical protein